MSAIRRAVPSDFAALKELIESGFRGDVARLGWNHEADILNDERITPEELTATLTDADTAMLVIHAETSPALAGCVAVTRKSAELAYLGLLCVDPARQSSGLGRQLLEAGEAYAVAQGISRMEMTVIAERDTLIAWYERRGYARTGETRPFPVVCEPPLHFVVLEKALRTA